MVQQHLALVIFYGQVQEEHTLEVQTECNLIILWVQTLNFLKEEEEEELSCTIILFPAFEGIIERLSQFAFFHIKNTEDAALSP